MNFRKGSVLILNIKLTEQYGSVLVVLTDIKIQMEALIFSGIFVLTLDLSLPVNSTSLATVLKDLYAVVKRV